MLAIQRTTTHKVEDIAAAAGISSASLNQIRASLKEKRLIDVSVRGYINYILPRFDEFVISKDYK